MASDGERSRPPGHLSLFSGGLMKEKVEGPNASRPSRASLAKTRTQSFSILKKRAPSFAAREKEDGTQDSEATPWGAVDSVRSSDAQPGLEKNQASRIAKKFSEMISIGAQPVGRKSSLKSGDTLASGGATQEVSEFETLPGFSAVSATKTTSDRKSSTTLGNRDRSKFEIDQNSKCIEQEAGVTLGEKGLQPPGVSKYSKLKSSADPGIFQSVGEGDVSAGTSSTSVVRVSHLSVPSSIKRRAPRFSTPITDSHGNPSMDQGGDIYEIVDITSPTDVVGAGKNDFEKRARSLKETELSPRRNIMGEAIGEPKVHISKPHKIDSNISQSTVKPGTKETKITTSCDNTAEPVISVEAAELMVPTRLRDNQIPDFMETSPVASKVFEMSGQAAEAPIEAMQQEYSSGGLRDEQDDKRSGTSGHGTKGTLHDGLQPNNTSEYVSSTAQLTGLGDESSGASLGHGDKASQQVDLNNNSDALHSEKEDIEGKSMHYKEDRELDKRSEILGAKTKREQPNASENKPKGWRANITEKVRLKFARTEAISDDRPKSEDQQPTLERAPSKTTKGGPHFGKSPSVFTLSPRKVLDVLPHGLRSEHHSKRDSDEEEDEDADCVVHVSKTPSLFIDDFISYQAHEMSSKWKKPKALPNK